MNGANNRSTSAAHTSERHESFVVDERYIREQASEAAALFLAPVSGILRVFFGRGTGAGGASAQLDVPRA